VLGAPVHKKAPVVTMSEAEHSPAADPSSFASRSSIEVAAALVFRDGKLLITQRPADAHLGGLWEFPGGKREPAESFEQCLVRELREELGIEVEVGPRLETVRHDYPQQTVHLEFFVCRWKRHEPQALGCPAFRWITAAELRDFEFPAADAQLIRRLETTRELWI
jgi:mutator protein MutT